MTGRASVNNPMTDDVHTSSRQLRADTRHMSPVWVPRAGPDRLQPAGAATSSYTPGPADGTTKDSAPSLDPSQPHQQDRRQTGTS